MAWGDILRDTGNHGQVLYVWLFCSQQSQMVKHVSNCLRAIEELQSTKDLLSDFQDDILTEISLIINCHSVGLEFLSINHGKLYLDEEGFHIVWKEAISFSDEELKRWDDLLQFLVDSMWCVANIRTLLLN